MDISQSYLLSLDEKTRNEYCLNILKINCPEYFQDVTLEEYTRMTSKTEYIYEEPSEKKCIKCGIVKPIKEYYRQKLKGVYRRIGSCGSCMKLIHKRYRDMKKNT